MRDARQRLMGNGSVDQGRALLIPNSHLTLVARRPLRLRLQHTRARNRMTRYMVNGFDLIPEVIMYTDKRVMGWPQRGSDDGGGLVYEHVR